MIMKPRRKNSYRDIAIELLRLLYLTTNVGLLPPMLEMIHSWLCGTHALVRLSALIPTPIQAVSLIWICLETISLLSLLVLIRIKACIFGTGQTKKRKVLSAVVNSSALIPWSTNIGLNLTPIEMTRWSPTEKTVFISTHGPQESAHSIRMPQLSTPRLSKQHKPIKCSLRNPYIFLMELNKQLQALSKEILLFGISQSWSAELEIISKRDSLRLSSLLLLPNQ